MADGSAKSAVLMSGKPGCFIAGADIRVRKGCFCVKCFSLDSGSLCDFKNLIIVFCFQLLSELQVLCGDKFNVIVPLSNLGETE